MKLRTVLTLASAVLLGVTGCSAKQEARAGDALKTSAGVISGAGATFPYPVYAVGGRLPQEDRRGR